MDDDGDRDLLTPWGHKEYDSAWDPQAPSLHLWGTYGFDDVTTEGLPETPGTTWRVVLPADFDGDGATDLLWLQQVGPPSMQRGVPTGNRWVEVELPSPEGFGAWVEVDGLVQRYVPGGSGLHSSLPPVLRVGIGGRDAARQVDVTWPDGSTESFGEVGAGERLIVGR